MAIVPAPDPFAAENRRIEIVNLSVARAEEDPRQRHSADDESIEIAPVKPKGLNSRRRLGAKR
jgi:hypothetical protein